MDLLKVTFMAVAKVDGMLQGFNEVGCCLSLHHLPLSSDRCLPLLMQRVHEWLLENLKIAQSTIR
jgi:hypothetical protein